MHRAGHSSVKIGILVSYYLPQDVSDPETAKKLYSAEKAGRCLGRKEKASRHVGTRPLVIRDARRSSEWPVSGVQKLTFMAHYGAVKPRHKHRQDGDSRPLPQ